MNTQLQEFARQTIKDGLVQCTATQKLLFKHMYSPDDLGRDIEKVVDEMPEDRLDWAMQQLQKTLNSHSPRQEAGLLPPP